MSAYEQFLQHLEASENFLCFSPEEMAEHEAEADRLFDQFTDLERESILDQLDDFDQFLD